jgi:hypothetical protein
VKQRFREMPVPRPEPKKRRSKLYLGVAPPAFDGHFIAAGENAIPMPHKIGRAGKEITLPKNSGTKKTSRNLRSSEQLNRTEILAVPL